MKHKAPLTTILGSLFSLLLVAAPSWAGPSFSLGVQESSNWVQAEPIVCPKPEIPSELHEQCHKSCCIARFTILEDGKHKVKLLASSGVPEVDEIALSTLKRWKFKPATMNGKAVESSRKIRVEFEVE